MTAQAPYESLRAELLSLARECDGIEGLGSGVIAHRIRCIVVEHEAALPERAPVSAGGDAWRFLADGEVMQAGDEVIADGFRMWEPVDEYFHGQPVTRSMKSIRRRASALVETRLPEGVTAMACPTCGEHVQYREEATPAPPVGADWTDEQCIAFMAVALRHTEYKRGNGGPTLNEIRQGVRRALMLAAAPTPAEARGVGALRERSVAAEMRAEADTAYAAQTCYRNRLLLWAARLDALAANKPAGEVSDA